jgi:hypothetical protein
VEEDAAVARVVRPQVREVGAGRAEGRGRGGDEAGEEDAAGTEVAEEAEQRFPLFLSQADDLWDPHVMPFFNLGMAKRGHQGSSASLR